VSAAKPAAKCPPTVVIWYEAQRRAVCRFKTAECQTMLPALMALQSGATEREESAIQSARFARRWKSSEKMRVCAAQRRPSHVNQTALPRQICQQCGVRGGIFVVGTARYGNVGEQKRSADAVLFSPHATASHRIEPENKFVCSAWRDLPPTMLPARYGIRARWLQAGTPSTTCSRGSARNAHAASRARNPPSRVSCLR